jgi:hypothetical protein
MRSPLPGISMNAGKVHAETREVSRPRPGSKAINQKIALSSGSTS